MDKDDLTLDQFIAVRLRVAEAIANRGQWNTEAPDFRDYLTAETLMKAGVIDIDKILKEHR